MDADKKTVRGQEEERKGGVSLLSARSGMKVTLNPKGVAYQLETKEKSYNVLLKELKKTGVELLEEDLSEKAKVDGIVRKTVTKKVRQWLHEYVTFMQTAIDLQALLPLDRNEEHLSRHGNIEQELNMMKTDMDALQKELLSFDQETRSGGSATSMTSSAMRANIMMLRL